MAMQTLGLPPGLRAHSPGAGVGSRAAAIARGQVSTMSPLPSPSPGVFLSYRRQDTGPYARLLKTQLAERFPGTPVFMDLDSIEPGTDFAEEIEIALRSTGVLIALIGARWLTAADDQGRRRLDDPGDYVRFEIQTALEQNTRIIPVTVDGTPMPRQKQLPVGLRKLARLSALDMNYARLEYDEGRLMAVVGKVLGAAASSHVGLAGS